MNRSDDTGGLKYAPYVVRVIEAHKRQLKRDHSYLIPVIAGEIDHMPEGLVKSCTELYISKYSGCHPNYFKGICKRVYNEQKPSIQADISWGVTI